ncbi:MAG: hypothetical protein H6670_05465 [Anaerolineaceae bacterium]|nr:hypothetical protein [Anaerolineaceae bacterium]
MTKTIVLILLVFFIASCSIQNEPTQFRELLLRNDGECYLPCFNDITPGVTTFDEANRILVESDEFSGDGDSMQYRVNGVVQATIDLVRASPISGSYLSRIEFSFEEPDMLNLNDVIDASYEPNTVFRGNIAGPDALNLMLAFEEEQIIVFLSVTNRVDPSSPINRIWLVAKQDWQLTLDDTRTIQGIEQQVEWLGYAPIEVYLSQ